ncbi:pyrroloquinoline quinone biosynthesis protein PqqE [Nitrospirillum iridis]|uniref:PqqA peptide cyclase n=1 Tax=Nitrospirillum iridis TaxID=765888 RepID=A0A7X0B3R6_9PROT|nr:pyrroloquinoline quinone biosynthesis protein PqqE [Nitrospirillum iridis]MBB6253689.1 pyrroloquinoline quinone biosynthesis protein E [Nitrospirillum iridis]
MTGPSSHAHAVEAPMGLLAELTHRCPLRCPYCSNPVELQRAGEEMDTATWKRLLGEAAALGVLQVHFSGGEPTARKDLPELVRHAASLGLYTNLITSGVLLDGPSLALLADAGLDHVQLSFQDVEVESAERIGGMPGAQARKLALARLVTDAGLPLTLNFVVHRQNLDRLPRMIALGLELSAARIEVAHVQYYGWSLMNRDALLPSRQQLERATAEVDAARLRLKGRMVIDYVPPDYYAARPKACMGGWARRFMNISPGGLALPCHAAETLPGFDWPSVATGSLAAAWYDSEAFNRYRGTAWMPEPCQGCERKEIDWGGCRCQAFALTGDAGRTDPACALSPDHGIMLAAIEARGEAPPDFIYRQYGPPPGIKQSAAKAPVGEAWPAEP